MLERFGAWANNHVAQMKPEVKGDWVRHSDVEATIADLQGQLKAAQAKLVDYETKTYCAFCGQTYLIDTGAELIARHIKECPKHPMRDVEQRVAQLEADANLLGQWERNRDEIMAELTILQADHARVLGLVQALPLAGLPVEHARSDDFVVLQANGEWMVHTYNYWAKFATEDEARAYIALHEYRASLPAQPAQGGA